MKSQLVAEETADGGQPCAAAEYTKEISSCLGSSLRNFQSLIKEREFDEISGVFLRICREGSLKGFSMQNKSKVLLTTSGLGDEPSDNPSVCTRMYFGATRPSSASTAVPSSSLSLCSASTEPSAASELPQANGNANLNLNLAYERKKSRNTGRCLDTSSVEARRLLDGRSDKGERNNRTSAAVSAQDSRRGAENNSTSLFDENALSCPATPSKTEEFCGGIRGKTKGKTKPQGPPPGAFLTRRSPRLQKTRQGIPRHDPHASPASMKQRLPPQQQQARAPPPPQGPPSEGEKSRVYLNAAKRHQGVPPASAEVERGFDEGELERSLSCRKGGEKTKQQIPADDRGPAAAAVSPPKSVSSKRKGFCRGTSAASLFGKKSSRAENQGTRTWQRKRARLEKEGNGNQGAPEAAGSQDASEAEDEPICRFAFPPLKEAADFALEADSAECASRFVSLSQLSVAAVQQEEKSTEDQQIQQETEEIRKEAEGPVAALQHKVLKALPEPMPQFDFGLFIVRAAAVSRHVDDIFPLLEDEELMERSVVLEKYLGPPKEGAKRRGDRFMLDKLVAEIPSQDGVYRPFLDIKEAPWCTGLDSGDGKELSKKEVLCQRIEEQRRWNPFSIFGSSPPSVELEDVFGYEVYRSTAPSARVHHPLFRRLSQFQSFKDLYSSLSREEWNRVSSAFRHHWNKQCRLDLDWTNDPLTVDEIMWMLMANEQVEDRSSHVYEAEICYCVTPNPNVGFGWNDPRCHRYKLPRPSMGCHILTQPPLVDGFLENHQEDAEIPQETTMGKTSSFSDPADLLDPSEELRAKPDGEEPADEKQNSVAGASGRGDVPGKGGKHPPSVNAFPTQVSAGLR